MAVHETGASQASDRPDNVCPILLFLRRDPIPYLSISGLDNYRVIGTFRG
jgi:hypothetical protein